MSSEMSLLIGKLCLSWSCHCTTSGYLTTADRAAGAGARCMKSCGQTPDRREMPQVMGNRALGKDRGADTRLDPGRATGEEAGSGQDQERPVLPGTC